MACDRKLTAYRRLAERAPEKLAPYLPAMKGTATASAPLPGSEFGAHGEHKAYAKLATHHRRIPLDLLRGMFRSHGVLTRGKLEAAESIAELGAYLGTTLTEREPHYQVDRQWASSIEDIRWRRTKLGLRLGANAPEDVARHVAEGRTNPRLGQWTASDPRRADCEA